MKNKGVWAVIAVFVCLMLAGEMLVYAVDPYSYDIEMTDDGNTLYYSLESSTSADYHVAVLSDTVAVGGVYCYYDSAYGVSMITHDQLSLMVEELETELDLRGAAYEGRLDAQELADLMSADLTQGTAAEHAFICGAGAFPDTVYTGAADDLLVLWLQAGGTVYWINGVIGLYSADAQGRLTAVAGYSELLFGEGGAVNTCDDMEFAEDPGNERELGATLSVYYSLINNGLRTDLPYSISIGFEQGGYGSVVLVRSADGNGTIGVFGGTSLRGIFNKEAPRFLAQVVAAHLGYSTVLLDAVDGSVDDSFAGTVDLSALSGEKAAFTYLGDTVALCGKYYRWT